MNGFEVRGKRLKVELNKKDEKSINMQTTALSQVNFDIWFPPNILLYLNLYSYSSFIIYSALYRV